jgi:hypothetical protein
MHRGIVFGTAPWGRPLGTPVFRSESSRSSLRFRAPHEGRSAAFRGTDSGPSSRYTAQYHPVFKMSLAIFDASFATPVPPTSRSSPRNGKLVTLEPVELPETNPRKLGRPHNPEILPVALWRPM